MKIRIISTVLILAIAYFGHAFLEQYLIPQDSAGLAVQQVKEDGSREKMRIQENAQNILDPACIVIVLSLLLIIWWDVIVKKVKDKKNVSSCCKEKK